MKTAALGLLSRRFALRLLSCAPLAAPPTLRAFAAESEQTPSEGFITPSGLRLFDFQTGKGPTPRWGQLIRLHYVGYTVSSTGGELEIFDSTYKRKDPYFTKHGNGQTVRGLEEAMHGMRAGGRRRVIIPAGQLSYITDKGPVPPGPQARDKMYKAVNDQQPLVFDVELISVMTDLLDRGDYDDGDVSDLRLDLREEAESEAQAAAIAAGERQAPGSAPAMGLKVPAQRRAETEAEAKRRQLKELGLSNVLSEAGEEAAAAKAAEAASGMSTGAVQ